MYCIHCGAKNPDEAKYCYMCGKNIENVKQKAAQWPRQKPNNNQTSPYERICKIEKKIAESDVCPQEKAQRVWYKSNTNPANSNFALKQKAVMKQKLPTPPQSDMPTSQHQNSTTTTVSPEKSGSTANTTNPQPVCNQNRQTIPDNGQMPQKAAVTYQTVKQDQAPTVTPTPAAVQKSVMQKPSIVFSNKPDFLSEKGNKQSGDTNIQHNNNQQPVDKSQVQPIQQNNPTKTMQSKSEQPQPKQIFSEQIQKQVSDSDIKATDISDKGQDSPTAENKQSTNTVVNEAKNGSTVENNEPEQRRPTTTDKNKPDSSIIPTSSKMSDSLPKENAVPKNSDVETIQPVAKGKKQPFFKGFKKPHASGEVNVSKKPDQKQKKSSSVRKSGLWVTNNARTVERANQQQNTVDYYNVDEFGEPLYEQKNVHRELNKSKKELAIKVGIIIGVTVPLLILGIVMVARSF